MLHTLLMISKVNTPNLNFLWPKLQQVILLSSGNYPISRVVR